MLRSFKTLAVIFILFAAVANLQAGDKIKIRLHQPPPQQLGVGDMWNLTLENTTKSDLKIYLAGSASEEKDGLIIEGKSKVFTIKPGRTNYKYRDFSGAEVKYNNGKYKEIILRTGNAPEGSYTICVNAFEESGEPAGMENCIMQTVQQLGSITLISPEDKAELDPDTLPGLMFSWTPLPKGGPYTLRIVELKGDQSPEVAIKENRPILDADGIKNTTYHVAPSQVKVIVMGMKYAWQVSSGDVKSDVQKFIIETETELVKPGITLISPLNGQEIDPDSLQGLVFEWKECPRCPPMYTLRIVEIKGSQSPDEAFRTNQPIFEKELRTTSYQGDPVHGVDVKLGMKLAWQVSSGDVVSEVYTFIVKKSGKDSSIFCKSEPARCMGQRCTCPKFFSELSAEKQNTLWVTGSSFMGIKLIRPKPGKGSGASIENMLVVFSGADPYLTGDPIAGVDVELEQQPGGIMLYKGNTDDKGTVVFKDADKIKEGKYEIRIMIDGTAYEHMLEVKQSNGKEDQIIAIADAKAGPLAGISAAQVPQNRLEKVDRVKGKVIKNPNGDMGIIIGDFPDKDRYVGDPVQDADVGLGRRPGGMIKWIKTDGNGLFDFSTVEPGNYIFKYVTKGDTTDFDINVSSGLVTKAAYVSNTEEVFDKFWISIELSGIKIGVGACPCFRVTCHCEHR